MIMGALQSETNATLRRLSILIVGQLLRIINGYSRSNSPSFAVGVYFTLHSNWHVDTLKWPMLVSKLA